MVSVQLYGVLTMFILFVTAQQVILVSDFTLSLALFVVMMPLFMLALITFALSFTLFSQVTDPAVLRNNWFLRLLAGPVVDGM